MPSRKGNTKILLTKFNYIRIQLLGHTFLLLEAIFHVAVKLGCH